MTMPLVVGHNLCADLPELWACGYLPRDIRCFDTYVAAGFLGYIDKSLKSLAAEILHKDITGFDPCMLEGEFAGALLREHNCTDVMATEMLYNYFKKFSYPPAFDLDMQFTPVLAEMIDRGFRIDVRAAKKLQRKYERQLRKIELPFNPASPKQVAAYFNLPDGQMKTMEQGMATLGELASWEAHATIEWKHLDKKVDYLRQFIEAADAEGRIHAHYDLGGTITGRMSCARPPLHSTAKTPEMRGVFRATPGYKLIVFDFSAGEYITAAFLSGNQEMIEKLKTQSPHAYVAEKYGITYAQGKTANFAALNMGGKDTLVRNCGMTPEQAKDFLNTYPLVTWARETIAKGQEDGFSSSPLGRTRVFTKASEGITEAVQGGLAEVGKGGCIKCREFDPVHNEHDSYLFEIEEQYAVEAAHEIKKRMEDNAFGIKVAGGVFDSWGEELLKDHSKGVWIE